MSPTASERFQSRYTDRKVVETLSTNIYGAKKGDLDDDSVRQAVIAAVSYCRKNKYVCMFGIVLESLLMTFVVFQRSGVVSQAAKNGYFLFSMQPLARTRMGVSTSQTFRLEDDLSGLRLVLGLLSDWVRILFLPKAPARLIPFRSPTQKKKNSSSLRIFSHPNKMMNCFRSQ